jgi:isoleucyl-tRNA synthetase
VFRRPAEPCRQLLIPAVASLASLGTDDDKAVLGPVAPREGVATIKQAVGEYAPAKVERRVREFWARTKAYHKTKALHLDDADYYYVDGPPYTTGSVHLGTALNKVIKDCVLRWRRMEGRNVSDRPGFDMHGLPIEVQVERSLGISNKKEIEELGIERFVNTCRDFALARLNRMTEQFAALGVWMDWANPYMTIRNEYIETAWWTLKKAAERGLLYESDRSLQWCTRCETALAEAEIDYWDETDPSIYVRMPLRGRRGEALLIWTTTPWTLPGNMAVAVHPDLEYAKVRTTRDGGTEYLWMLASSVDAVLPLGGVTDWEIVERKPGKDLVGWAYEPPLAKKVPYQAEVRGEWVHKVLPSETVTTDFTGCVHTAPGHGPEDFELGLRHDLPPFCPVDERGRFTQEVGDYRGVHVRDANRLIVGDLKDFKRLFAEDTLTHRYGHCWRCKTPIVYRVTRQWFLRVSDIKARMLEEIRRVRWHPDWVGSARQWDWTENLRDWCISRQRYWGIPIPIWKCSQCGALRVVGSQDELQEGTNYVEGMDLHRPWIDQVTFPCAECGGTMSRTKDILDVWFDSAVASWAILDYPRREDLFERWWPAKWIVEAPDQTRGWFNSQLTAGVVVFDRAPYESVMMHGWMSGPQGEELSKSAGGMEPERYTQTYGVDALRYYLLKNNPPWEDRNFQEEEVKNAVRALNIFWNTFRFATTYMVLDRFDPAAQTPERLVGDLRPEDRWLLSRLEGVKEAVQKELERYHLHTALRALEDFVLNDLSRWYVKLVRHRTWLEERDRSKLAAYHVLYEALRTTTTLLAPFCPHIAEAIYQDLGGERLSVHMEPWPAPMPERRARDLEEHMTVVQSLVETVSKERQRAKVKLRWPMRSIAIEPSSPGVADALATLREVFLAQTNAKDLVVLKEGETHPDMSVLVEPDPQAIGRVYKQWWSKIATLLSTRPVEEVRRAFESGDYEMGIEGQSVRITRDMVNFVTRLPEDVVRTETPHGVLYLDFRATPEIRAEAFAREIVRRIQSMRKEIDLDMADFVRTGVQVRAELAAMLDPWKDYVASETRSRPFALGADAVDEEYIVEWTIEGETVTLGITPLHMAEAVAELTRVPGITEGKAAALFDAGYRSLAALRGATKQELLAVDRLEERDVASLLAYVEAPPEETVDTCPACGGALPPEAPRCDRCGEWPTPSPDCPSCRAPLDTAEAPCRFCGHGGEAPPAAERPAPRPEAPSEGEPPSPPGQAPDPSPTELPETALPELRSGSTYLVLEEKPDVSYRLFVDAVKGGMKGFCVTRIYPDKVRKQYDLEDVPILWLSNVGKEDSVRPKDLEKLSLSLEQFLARDGDIILLDGLEYLITNNNFITVLRLVQSVRDQCAINDAVLLLSISPDTLDDHQQNLLGREVDQVLRPS